MKKLDLLGNKYTTYEGYTIEVIEYIKASDITIKYEDGEIRKTQLKELYQGNIKKSVNRVGEKHLTNEGYWIEIIEYLSHDNCKIQFEDGQVYSGVWYNNILKGCVKNKLRVRYYGVGYVGDGNYKTSINNKSTKAHAVWSNILFRCYAEKAIETNPTYKNVTVCKEWYNFQVFAEWFYKNCIEDFHLDKDLFSSDVKIYSPETCCFIPRQINNLFNRFERDLVGLYPLGILKGEKTYSIQISFRGKRRGEYGFLDLESAVKRYEFLKEQDIKYLAEVWKDKLKEEVYEKLISYKVTVRRGKEITQ